MSTDKKLQESVNRIADTLTHGFDEDELNVDDEPMTAMDYIFTALEIEYIVSSKREYLGARILVTFGGPSIWINTRNSMVEGQWGQDSAKCGYTDSIGLDDACQELYECVG